jgi:hypothetical protein
MDFQSMTGTSGIASAYNKLYVVDNRTILITDTYSNTETVNHDFDWITNIVLTDLYLFGIYSKNNKYGIFSMDLNYHTFKMVTVDYTPVNLTHANEMIYVFNTQLEFHTYEKNLELRGNKDKIPIVTSSPIQFMTVALATHDDIIYCSAEKDIYAEGKKLLSLDGDILSMVAYQDFLFIVYNSLYSHYAVIQYDLVKKEQIKTIEGGYISGPPVYSCIYDNQLYISASTNNIIRLDMFTFPMTKEKTIPRELFPMFEMNRNNPHFLTEQVSISTDKIKTLQETRVQDTTPATNSMLRYYVWVFILLFVIIVIALAFFFRENSVLPVLLLCILFIALSFLIKNSNVL